MIFTTIASATNPQMVWDVPNGTLDHVPVQQYTNNGGLGTKNQQWFLVKRLPPPDETPLYDLGHYIVSRCSGQLLGVAESDWQQKPSPLYLYQDFKDAAGLATQKWVDLGANGSTYFYTDLDQAAYGGPNYVIGIPEVQTQIRGAQLQLVPYAPLNRGGNRLWNLTNQDIKVFAFFSRQLQNEMRYAMDVPGFSQDDVPIQINQYNGGANQLWMVDPPSGEAQYHRIRAVHSDKVLQIANGGLLMQSTYVPNSENQEWESIPGRAESFSLQNHATGQMLDVSVNPDYISQNQPDGSANQEWWASEVSILYRDPIGGIP